MKWGPKAGEKQSDGEWFRKLAKEGVKIPEAVLHVPTLDRFELLYWEAFNTLHLSRAHTGFGPGAIPLSEIVTYAELMQMPVGEEREQFVQIVRSMDGAYLTWVQEHHDRSAH